ncbi:MAG: DUF6144 family protein [Methanomassiliicoccales archaeon]|nr:DUF6144 family protein [Methanomassiliicoccales archaeon]
MKERKNSPERLLAIARYASFHERPELFIYLTSILNSYNILPLIERRVGEMVGNASREVVFYGWERPPLGTPPEEYPQWTSRIIDRMEDELTPEQCRDIMTWNYHQIPEEAYAAKKARYESAPSLDEFLASEHHLLVEELKNCLKTGKVWYEQEVTQEFVDHVASDQRLQTGIRQGDRIIIKKVPFDPKHFYAEKNPVLRRYHYCHCPLARSAIKNGRPRISSTFCYCSAGFTKAPWEVIFDQPVKVEVLKSVLDGDDGCEFAIRIPVGKMK